MTFTLIGKVLELIRDGDGEIVRRVCRVRRVGARERRRALSDRADDHAHEARALRRSVEQFVEDRHARVGGRLERAFASAGERLLIRRHVGDDLRVRRVERRVAALEVGLGREVDQDDERVAVAAASQRDVRDPLLVGELRNVVDRLLRTALEVDRVCALHIGDRDVRGGTDYAELRHMIFLPC